jgi:hypothetical protein
MFECPRCWKVEVHAPWCPSREGAATTPQPPSSGPQSAPTIPGSSTTSFRRGRAGKPGRPTVPAAEQRQKARDRDRAYRARQRHPRQSDGDSSHNPQPGPRPA